MCLELKSAKKARLGGTLQEAKLPRNLLKIVGLTINPSWIDVRRVITRIRGRGPNGLVWKDHRSFSREANCFITSMYAQSPNVKHNKKSAYKFRLIFEKNYLNNLLKKYYWCLR